MLAFHLKSHKNCQWRESHFLGESTRMRETTSGGQPSPLEAGARSLGLGTGSSLQTFFPGAKSLMQSQLYTEIKILKTQKQNCPTGLRGSSFFPHTHCHEGPQNNSQQAQLKTIGLNQWFSKWGSRAAAARNLTCPFSDLTPHLPTSSGLGPSHQF